ncbi:hypothetical protein FDH01_gp289 [Acinetobacter phage vB_AbaM_ME3]|uniref:Uncharacterized protein n=1 Tax=Acinetobacter phage vB_AbaM_ME3 TaxID=1837876 RepID=A0A172Q0M2_9CAUD|nr:hypothetical protein FDH01_gp289 [Acinetobacter phage vB_AbaM_ME3]AND75333.1 hypothetical protein ME3_172 [Acinetobacter phage vB_AbaM_ME3]
MTKQRVTRTIDVEDWSLARIINHVESLGLSVNDVNITTKAVSEYFEEYKIAVAEYLELETDEEYEKRIKEEQAYRLSVADREKQEYERLKKKYG